MRAFVLLLPLALGGCIVSTVAKTAVDIVTLPVKVASAGVDAVTTSQAEADQKAGRDARRADEDRGRQIRLAQQRCRQGKPLSELTSIFEPVPQTLTNVVVKQRRELGAPHDQPVAETSPES